MSIKSVQSDVTTFKSGAKDTETIVRTLKIPLQTSNRKNERLRHAIDQWQDIAGRVADLMPSFDKELWTPQTTTLSRTVREEFPDHDLKSHVAYEAGYKVASSFSSWESNGCNGERPQFGGDDYINFDHASVTVEKNDNGWGVKLGLEPYKPEWFGIDGASYHRQFLEGVTSGDKQTGSAEVRYNGGNPTLHITIKWDVDVYRPKNVSRFVGVDIGENVLFSSAVMNVGDIGEVKVEDVSMRKGGEFRHYREKLDEQRRQLSQKGDLRGVKNCKGDRRRYTDQVTNGVSKTIVDIADAHKPSCVVLEDLTNYRETADDPIHDWPYAMIQEQIMYKATGRGIPVISVDPAGTSQTCRRCGDRHPEYRDGHDFDCWNCGYEIHADVNAAMNIGLRGSESIS